MVELIRRQPQNTPQPKPFPSLSHLKDEELVRILQQKTVDPEGAKDAAGELFQRYQSRVKATCSHLMWDRDLADDAAQKTFEKMIKSIGSYKPDENDPSRFRKWLTTIAARTSVDANRATHKDKMVTATKMGLMMEELPDLKAGEAYQQVSREELAEILHDRIQQLPEKHRQIIDPWLQGKTYQEIAGQAGLPVGTVKSRLHLARKTLGM